jgi:xanthine dehydrogenase YagS FAD-binding subunit
MHPFVLTTVSDPAVAAAAHARDPGLTFIAGGTDLLGLMKDRAALPPRLMDINHLPGLAQIETRPDGGLRIGALARMSDVAADMEVRRAAPMASEALLASASAQLRNMASIGGNLMQRTRCSYFRDADGPPCNKRTPGSGCAARHGLNRGHAIFGWSDACVATHPSDLAVVLAALDAEVRVLGPEGGRAIAFRDFHRLPGDAPEHDNTLGRGELIVGVDLPFRPEARRSHYLKVRERRSYEFALVSVAAGLDLDGRRIRSARVAMGGVSHKPWRLFATEQALVGAGLDDAAALRAAVAQGFAEARPLERNAFKIELSQRAVLRALQTAGARA